MRNLMKKVLSGSVMFGALLVLSACGSSNNTTDQSGVNSCPLTSTQYGCLTQTAQCNQYGANFGQASNGQCVQGTVSTTIGTVSCTLTSPQYGCLTQTAQCSALGVNVGQASTGQCVQGQINTTVNTGTTIGTTATSCQAGTVQTQNGCLPQGPCMSGYGFGFNQQNNQPWCFPVTTGQVY